jgi:uncharacterized small protein (DUF1192 family)
MFKGFSCRLTVLYRGLGKKITIFEKKELFSSCKILHLVVIRKPLVPNPDWNQCGSTTLLPGAHSVNKIRAQKFRSGYRHPHAEMDLTSFLLTSLFSPAEMDWRNSLLTCWGRLEEFSSHLLKWTEGSLFSPAEVDWRISLLTCRSGLKDLSSHLLKWTEGSLFSPAEVDCRISLLTCWSGL